MLARTVCLVALMADGSTVLLHDGPVLPPYSSASCPSVCPTSWRTSSTAETCVDATATEPPEPPYSGSLTMTRSRSREFAAGMLADATVMTLPTFTQMSRWMPEQL